MKDPADISPAERRQRTLNQRILIMEMIDASIELSRKLGTHPLAKGCGCIACVNRRKRSVTANAASWRYRL